MDLNLYPKQSEAFSSEATEILYGGSAGGGKSHFMRVAACAWASMIPGLQVYLFRRIREDLIKNHMEGPTGFHMLLAPLSRYGHVKIVEDEIRFWNGAKIYLCHCKDEKDRLKYLGTEIHLLLIDELTMFTETIYRFLRSRVRLPSSMRIPEEYKTLFPRIICSSNPGGIGHQFVKSTWIDPKPPMEIWRTNDDEGGFLRQYIPAKLSDNPSLDQSSYSRNLSGLGNPDLVKAMLEGDWDVVAGAAFEITRDRHAVRPFKPPKEWTKFQVIDWGFVRPYAVCWFCVSDQDTIIAGKNGAQDKLIPKGAIIMYRELYGWNGKPNEGAREESDIVARKIIAIEEAANETMDYRVADSAMWAKSDGPSVCERMMRASKGKFNPRQSIKDRQANYSEVCSRLRGFEFDKGIYVPMFYVTENCLNFWRTVPSLVLDSINPEKGPDTEQEDHCLTADSKIITENGEERIDQISTGTMVLTTNGFKECIQLGETSIQSIVDIKLSDGSVISCTKGHRLLTTGGSYVRCCDLHEGDILCALTSYQTQPKNSVERDFGYAETTLDDNQNTESAKGFIASGGKTILFIVERKEKFPVWNLHVPGPNNYILANGVISHNCYDCVSYGLMSRPYIMTEDQRIVSKFKRLRRENKLDNVDPYRIKPIFNKRS